MPFVRFTNKTGIRRIKGNFIWLDHIVFIKGEPHTFVLLVRGVNSKTTLKFPIPTCTTVNATKEGRLDFNDGFPRTFIQFKSTNVYVLELKDCGANFQSYNVTLHFK